MLAYETTVILDPQYKVISHRSLWQREEEEGERERENRDLFTYTSVEMYTVQYRIGVITTE